MIEHIDKLARAGVTSFKIEGRAKSSYYVAVITNAYRSAVDELAKMPDCYRPPKWITEEVNKVSHRKYSSGFFFGQPENSQNTRDGGYIRSYDVAAVVKSCADGYISVTQRNRFFRGDRLEVLLPKTEPFEIEVTELLDKNGEPSEAANKAAESYKIRSEIVLPEGTILRMKNS